MDQEYIESRINCIASMLPLITSDSTDDIKTIASIFGELTTVTDIPKAFTSLLQRGASLANMLLSENVSFDSVCTKLNKCITKASTEVRRFHQNNTASDDHHEHAENVNDSAEEHTDFLPIDYIPEDLIDLLSKFGNSQQNALEDFEQAVLDFEEKGDTQARDLLKRILHTWKGEFGVLGLNRYATLIHRVEEKLEQGEMSIDKLLQLNDLIGEKCTSFSSGKPEQLNETEFNAILSQSTQDKNSKKKKSSSDVLEDKNSSESTAPLASQVESAKNEPVKNDINNPEVLLSVDPSLLEDFINEALEHIESVDNNLLKLETDLSNIEYINTIFRGCHTIKGVAGFLNLTHIGMLSHSLENLIDMARKNSIELNTTYLDIMFEAVDCLKHSILQLKDAEMGSLLPLPENFANIMDKLHLCESGKTPLTEEEIPQEEETLKSENTDTFEEEIAEQKVGEILVSKGVVQEEEINEALKEQEKTPDKKIGEILVEQKAATPREVGKAIGEQVEAKQKANSTGATKENKIEETIRVPVRKLDQLIDSIGEGVIAQSMLTANTVITQSSTPELDKQLSLVATIMRQIQELSMSLRMVSVKSTFQKMARLVRDLSKKTGKSINFITEGENTELDKSVVENIGDPLIHMIRNSVDHGIEAEADRKAAGKPPQGLIKLSAFHKGGNVIVQIEDDGKGLNKERILEKAIEKNLLKENEKYSDQEIFQIIFSPGFSTAAQVTDVSGRGVGMDVVWKNIHALRGSIEVHSTPGKGSTFTIRLPLTLAIINGIIVKCDDEKYIIPTLSIDATLKPKFDDIDTVQEAYELLKFRDELIPLLRLSELFETSLGERRNPENGIVIVIENMLGKRIGLLADEILDQQQVVIKSLGDTMKHVPGVAGGAIMNDGNVSLIIDIAGIFSLANSM